MQFKTISSVEAVQRIEATRNRHIMSEKYGDIYKAVLAMSPRDSLELQFDDKEEMVRTSASISSWRYRQKMIPRAEIGIFNDLDSFRVWIVRKDGMSKSRHREPVPAKREAEYR